MPHERHIIIWAILSTSIQQLVDAPSAVSLMVLEEFWSILLSNVASVHSGFWTFMSSQLSEGPPQYLSQVEVWTLTTTSRTLVLLLSHDPVLANH